MSNNIKKVLLVGTGNMSIEYVKVLDKLDITYEVVGNTEESVQKFFEATRRHAFIGGIQKYINNNNVSQFDYAIIAVNIGYLYEASRLLVMAGIKKILLEKPGSVTLKEISTLRQLANENNADIYIAYNRRFYKSVEHLNKLVAEDGGIKAVSFEFTEWGHVIEKTSHPDNIKQKWFLMNSSHVVDLVFYLIGYPAEMHANISGENELYWHKVGCNYSGCGISSQNIPFTYQAYWNSPGRWSVEVITDSHRFYLKPMEKLLIQNKGSIDVLECQLDDVVDIEYKPGLYEEVCAFLNVNSRLNDLCTIGEQERFMKLYEEISGERY